MKTREELLAAAAALEEVVAYFAQFDCDRRFAAGDICNEYGAKAKELRAQANQAEQGPVSELWWLIETKDATSVLYATGEAFDGWTRDVNEAARFKTKKAADFVCLWLRLRMYDDNGFYHAATVHLTEHMFNCGVAPRVCECEEIGKTLTHPAPAPAEQKKHGQPALNKQETHQGAVNVRPKDHIGSRCP